MKRKLFRTCLFFTFLLCLFAAFALSGSAAAYEPDGSLSVEYEFEEGECDRSVLVEFKDEGGGLLKAVEIRTKRGEEGISLIGLYNYNLISFISDQGLWETCKLGWESGGDCLKFNLWLTHHFRTALSQERVHVIAIMEPFDEVEVTVNHLLEYRFGYNGSAYGTKYADTSTAVLACGDFFEAKANQYEGFTLDPKYISSISGNWSMSWINSSENLPADNECMEWEMVYDPKLKDQHEDWSEYSEAEDGVLSYARNRKVTITFFYKADICTYTFDVNGGTGAPEPLRSWYDPWGFYDFLFLPETVPIREGYRFLGWGDSPTATEVLYTPGQQIDMGLSRTLYAVWERIRYDLSVCLMEVAPQEIYKYNTVTAEVRVDNWDDKNAYADVPLVLLYDGETVFEPRLHLDAYGYATVTVKLNVGGATGERELEARINWDAREKEIDSENNRDTRCLEISEYEFELSAEPILPNAPYVAGDTVITAFAVYNDSGQPILPEHENTVCFSVYTEAGELLFEDLKTVAIPTDQVNLVWFAWVVPQAAEGERLLCRCEVNADRTVYEENRQNNLAEYSSIIAAKSSSQTPDPTLESHWQAGSNAALPQSCSERMTWSTWVYENGSFVKRQYGVGFASVLPQLVPYSQTARQEQGLWVMRSGYGVELVYVPTLTAMEGCAAESSMDCSPIQGAVAGFPEFGYSDADGSFRVLELTQEGFAFVQNSNAANAKRLHFIPAGYPDGAYRVFVSAYVWTPAGRICVMQASDAIQIEGSLYDDWYQG